MTERLRQPPLFGLESYVLTEPHQWHECDWSHWAVSSCARPTEDVAFENINQQAYTYRRTSGLLDFDDDMWLVYFVDMDLHIRYPDRTVYPKDIGKALGFLPERVLIYQRRLDNVVEARLDAGLPTLPPIPIRHIKRSYRLATLAAKKGIRWAA